MNFSSFDEIPNESYIYLYVDNKSGFPLIIAILCS